MQLLKRKGRAGRKSKMLDFSHFQAPGLAQKLCRTGLGRSSFLWGMFDRRWMEIPGLTDFLFGGVSMRGKLALALVVGMFIGAGTIHLMNDRQVQAQPEQKAKVWEYRRFVNGPFQKEGVMPDPSGVFNQAAKDGWEYADVMFVWDGPKGTYSQVFLFKRLTEKK
jgi:hypothetical protein